ncbi:protein phosphatase 1 regulatory subunit 14D [Mixophyes fleayi]|uniref:protein phosphatase 1 regulatory subunit 14D n=1 Tax=Mixophyes fleayi TaxID=3061075 RepID=UPI003F4D7C9C
MATSDSGTTRVTFVDLEKQEEDVTPKKFGKLTVKYNRKELQRRIKLEEWIDTNIQELYQTQDLLRDEAAEPEIDIDDLLDLSLVEQRSRLQDILQECTRPTECQQTYCPTYLMGFYLLALLRLLNLPQRLQVFQTLQPVAPLLRVAPSHYKGSLLLPPPSLVLLDISQRPLPLAPQSD